MRPSRAWLGICTPVLVTFLEPLALPVSVPTEYSFPPLAMKRSIVYVPVNPFVPVTATFWVSGVADCACAALGSATRAHPIAAASAAVRSFDIRVLPTRTGWFTRFAQALATRKRPGRGDVLKPRA